MKKNLSFLAAFGVLAALFGGCATAPTSDADRQQLTTDCGSTLDRMKLQDPSIVDFLNHADGYAVFPVVGKGGFIAGGAYGRGEVYEQGNFLGYTDMSQATIGAQVGGQSYAELVVFQTQGALNRFQTGQFAFAADASAVALKSGAGATAKYDNGVAVFVQVEGGLMLEAAIGGQSFSYQPK
jgi:lipid-binding SYLF domain-containing protein